MASITQAFEHYLYEAINVQVQVKPWPTSAKLPFFLKDLYTFYEFVLFGKPCVVVMARSDDALTPGTIGKHFEQLQEKFPGLYIYVCTTISSYNRKRLIEHRVPFVTPGNQMYLPNLGIDLREHFLKPYIKREMLSPATQAVVIYALTHPENEQFTSLELAKELHYTAMTMSRAFRELATLGIGKVSKKGRESWLRFTQNGQQLWEHTKPLMRSPVKKRVWLKQNKSFVRQIEKLGVVAGLTALSQCSMIHQPTIPIYAIDNKALANWLHKGIFKELPSYEEANLEIEVWNYTPSLFAKENLADPFSLYLSLQDNQDDRVEIALTKMMEQLKW